MTGDPLHLARGLLRRSLSAVLSPAETKSDDVQPITVPSACMSDGRPLIRLAKGSENADLLSKQPHISLFYDGADLPDDRTSDCKVTLVGDAKPSNEERIVARFSRRHPIVGSVNKSDDFICFTMDIGSVSLQQGAERHIEIDPAEYVLDVTEGEEEIKRADGKNLRLNEEEALDHMNLDHPEIAEAFATQLLQRPGGGWQFTGFDPEGCDLRKGDDRQRLEFPRNVLDFAGLKVCVKEFLSQPMPDSESAEKK